MATQRITAPAHPSKARRAQAAQLKSKGRTRTKQETDDLVDLLVARIDDLEDLLRDRR